MCTRSFPPLPTRRSQSRFPLRAQLWAAPPTQHTPHTPHASTDCEPGRADTCVPRVGLPPPLATRVGRGTDTGQLAGVNR